MEEVERLPARSSRRSESGTRRELQSYVSDRRLQARSYGGGRRRVPWSVASGRIGRKPSWRRLALVAGIAALLLACAPFSTASAQEPTIHPTFPLLDADGVHVLTSGGAVSTMKTCGNCHDTSYIAETSFHADAGLDSLAEPGSTSDSRAWDLGPGYYGRWDPTVYRLLTPAGDALLDLGTADWIRKLGIRHAGGGPSALARDGTALTTLSPTEGDPETHVMAPETGGWQRWDWQKSGIVELNCFLCHTSEPNNEARIEVLSEGEFAWAATATLLGSGVVERDASGWQWQEEAFDATGSLSAALSAMRDPENDNCAMCHGLAHADEEPILTAGCRPGQWETERRGQIVSAQRMSESGLNLANKQELWRSWDVHAERLVDCVDCHHSGNNPLYSAMAADGAVLHLAYDARKMDIADYLYRPSHDLARAAQDGSSLQCTSCHQTSEAHEWLPYQERHFAALSCQACHIPHMNAPAKQQFDWTVLAADGQAKVECRGVLGQGGEPAALITGFEPALLSPESSSASASLAPYNVVASWYWVYGEPPTPVRLYELERAYLTEDGYCPEVVEALDDDGDGALTGDEVRLVTHEEVDFMARRLEDLGLSNPRIMGELQPYAINHGVAGGEWVISECETCHSADSRLSRDFALASYLPGGVMPDLVPGSPAELSGEVVVGDDGALLLKPRPAELGLYVIGRDRTGWVGWLGALTTLVVAVGIGVHGGMRLYHSTRSAKHEPSTRRVYMYTAYERTWHWLQALAIALLIATGFVIHRPDIFSFADYQIVVRVHNVLGFILLANAALAVFYHVAGGGIRRFVPEPKGFFDQAIAQLLYYLRGIMRGDRHPFEKQPEKRLNPLQQVTYLVILNVLLPLQVVTGVLMWSSQLWPGAAESVGGLWLLAGFHTLLAWLFVAFLIMHMYLTTTGHTTTSSIEAMIVGWEDVAIHPSEDAPGKFSDRMESSDTKE